MVASVRLIVDVERRRYVKLLMLDESKADRPQGGACSDLVTILEAREIFRWVAQQDPIRGNRRQ